MYPKFLVSFFLVLAGTSAFCGTPLNHATQTVAKLAPVALLDLLRKLPKDQQTLIGAPRCGAAVYKFGYNTVGGAGEPTSASGALMVPFGSASFCHGSRPIVLFAHGTAIERSEDLSAINDPGNPAHSLAARIALIFAAQGFIVIAPNYAGYDSSPLPYTPYLNGRQEARDMLDGLSAGRNSLSVLHVSSSDNGKLFVTGYSQGGYVALATLKALDEQGHPATAGAPMSGPYALAAAGDEVFLGHPNFGATVYLSLIANSYAHLSQGGINLTEVFNPQYRDAPHLFPGDVPKTSFKSLVEAGKIPLTAIFQSPPTGYENLDGLHEGFLNTVWLDPTNYLINSAYRSAYISDVVRNPDGAAPPDGSSPNLAATLPSLPAHPQHLLRQNLKANDLRNYVPTMPLFLCGAHQDPEVFWKQGTGTLAALLNSGRRQNPGLRYAVLDLDTRDVSGTFTSYGFSKRQRVILENQAEKVQSGFVARQYHNALDKVILLLGLEGYHSAQEPYCTVAVRTFFKLY